MTKKNDMDFFNSEILSFELDLPKPSKNFNSALKKFTQCTNNDSNKLNHATRATIIRSFNIESSDDLTSFLKSGRAEKIRANLVKIFESQYQRELDELKANRKKIFRFSNKFNMLSKHKLSSSGEETSSNLQTSSTSSTSNLPLLSMLKINLASLFRHTGDEHNKFKSIDSVVDNHVLKDRNSDS